MSKFDKKSTQKFLFNEISTSRMKYLIVNCQENEKWELSWPGNLICSVTSHYITDMVQESLDNMRSRHDIAHYTHSIKDFSHIS